MKKTLLPAAFTLLSYCYSFSQNLVPNPSFEQFDTCPNSVSQIKYAIPWILPTQGTSDYLNSCASFDVGVPNNFFGYQNARTGNAYAGIFACFMYPDSSYFNYREYVEVKLNIPLAVSAKYFISFYVSLADSMNYATDNIGAYISIDTIKNYTNFNNLLVIPQIANPSGNFLSDKTGWTKVSGSYIANGGEQFITIGNFKDYYNTDTIHASGGSSNTSQSDWSGGYYYIDDICVSTDSLTCNPPEGIDDPDPIAITIFPNPVSHFLMAINISNNLSYSFVDILGHTIKEGKINKSNPYIDVSTITNGFYMFSIDKKYFYKILINN